MEKPSVGLKLLTYRDEDAMVFAIIAPSGRESYLSAAFRLNEPSYLNYNYMDPNKPFCETYFNPKLRELKEQFSTLYGQGKLSHL
jgi:hypothetical protein